MDWSGSPIRDFAATRCTGLLLQVGVLSILFVGWRLPYVSARSSSDQAQDQERTLRTRVEEFYNLIRVGSWSQAESYVTQDSLDAFRNQTKTPFQSYQIDSIKLQPDARSATVQITIKVMMPYSPTPFAFPRASQWRLVNGEWYVQIPGPPRGLLKSMVQQPPSAPGASHREPPPVELKFSNAVYTILDAVQPGQVKEARFPFTNVSDHVVRLGEVVTGREWVRLKTEKKEYKPGESGTLEFEVDPIHRDYGYGFADTITVKTEPGGATTLLTIRMYVAPSVAANGKTEAQE